MRADLDRLMMEAQIDGLIVIGDKAANPYRAYLTRHSKANGSVFMKRGEPAVFVVNSGMELDEAATSGLKVYTLADFGQSELMRNYNGAADLVSRDLFCNILRQLEFTGKIALFGVADLNTALLQVTAVDECMPDVQIVLGGLASTLFDKAYSTKDDAELVAMRESARLTGQVVSDTWEFIGQHRERNGVVIDKDGTPLTIGRVKRFIRLREIELGLEDPSGCIFAQGREAGIPHSHGHDEDALVTGKSIVFDIYPRLLENGYFHDMTRTWCIDHADDEVQAAYDEVMHVFRETSRAFKVGEPTAQYQAMACDYFEAHGHPTARSAPGTLEGYVHSLGHGLGLNVHEAPYFRQFGSDTLQPGSVFTVEPGLYYPERGFGVRVEDTVCFDEWGKLNHLTDFPYDLVLPLKG